jgi:hypothetical protein
VKVKIYKTIILPVVLYGCETFSSDSRKNMTDGVPERGSKVIIWTKEG